MDLSNLAVVLKEWFKLHFELRAKCKLKDKGLSTKLQTQKSRFLFDNQNNANYKQLLNQKHEASSFFSLAVPVHSVMRF